MNRTRAEAGIHGRYLPSSWQCTFVYLFFSKYASPPSRKRGEQQIKEL
jgi:hypothetical protein